MRQEALTGRRGAHARLAAHQQRLTRPLLQLAHLFTDGRLRQEHFGRRRRQAARVQHRNQRAKLIQIESAHGLSNG